MIDSKKAQQLRLQGLSYRKIATELGVSKSTVANHFSKKPVKFQAQPNQPPAFDPLNQMHMLPPAAGRAVVPSYLQHTGVFRAGKDYYYPWDLAIRDNRENARNCWNNLLVREPLQARLWATAEQDWHIEPEDKRDSIQVETARKLQRIIEGIPDFLKLRYSLLKSRWFGVYGCQIQYEWDAKRQLTVKRWSELHGDSLVFKLNTDEVGVYVTASGGGPEHKNIESEAGFLGRVHKFDQQELAFDDQGQPYQKLSFNERQAVIVMSYDPQQSDFLDPRGAGGVKGTGLRSVVYPTWLQMSGITGWMIDWLERFGTGITLYKFRRGNEASYLASKQMAESQDKDASVMVPVDDYSGVPVEGIERIEPSAVGLENVQAVINFFGDQIRRFIVGQDSTSKPVSTGLGSEIASVQENTFGRIVHFDCVDLQETLTRQLVQVIQEWSFPGTPPCKFVVDFAKPNIKEQMEAIKSAYDMGVSFVEDEIRSLTGCTKPTQDDLTICNKQDQQFPGLPMPGLQPNGLTPLNESQAA